MSHTDIASSDSGGNITWPSPAKLNLFLHITGRRPDGYHELQSLFQLLDFGDSMAFQVTEEPEILLEPALPGVANEDNLVVKAAKSLQQHSGVQQGCRIRLTKRLPMGGGIGGGSSNAATTLLALNHYWQCGLSNAELQQLGLGLGADVPVFVAGATAFATGVGEQLTPVSLPEQYYLVVNPSVHISTAAVFGHPDLPRNTPLIATNSYQFAQTGNDCQGLVTQLYPRVAMLLQWLLEYAPSRLTGTGSCIFAVFDQREKAEEILQKLPEGCQGFVAKGVNQSPVQQLLTSLE